MPRGWIPDTELTGATRRSLLQANGLRAIGPPPPLAPALLRRERTDRCPVQGGWVIVPHGWRAALAAMVLAVTTASASGTEEFQVIVHASVQGTRITRANLSALFTGRTFQWGDKTLARPVDQSTQAPVRRAFTASVIGLSMGELQMYWQRRVSSDHVFPPPVKGSDEAVLGYVAATAGAVGYVGPETAVPEGVKIIAVVD